MIKIYDAKKNLMKEYDSRFLQNSFEKHVFYNASCNEKRKLNRQTIELMIDEHNTMINSKINQKLGITNELRTSQTYLIEISKLFDNTNTLIAERS